MHILVYRSKKVPDKLKKDNNQIRQTVSDDFEKLIYKLGSQRPPNYKRLIIN